MAAALEASLISDKRLDRFKNCGDSVAVFREKDQPERYVLKGNYCHDRFCVPCQTARGTTIRKNLIDHVHKRYLRFLTLTLHSTTHGLPELLQHLYTSFTKLRKTSSWKRHVHGGVAFLEVKYNQDARRWHPHLHILFEGTFYPQKEIKAEWFRITRTSHVVDIRTVPDKQRAISYLVGYVTKGFKKQITEDHDKLCEAITAMRGKTCVFTFGAWRGLKLLATPEPSDLEYVGDLYTILLAARNKDRTSVAIIQQLFADHPPPNPRSPPQDANSRVLEQLS